MLSSGTIEMGGNAKAGTERYHDPCMSSRKMGVYDAPRQVTEAATGQPSAELLHSRALAECCGAGLVMFLPEPVLAEQVANVRLPWSLAYQRWRVSV